MTEDAFQSSDSIRSGRPLLHLQSVTFDRPFSLEHGDQLSSVTVAYETYGQLNAARDNAVLVCHALSGDSHVARHDDQDDPGWWDLVVGPGRTIDTDKYFVICPNVLGGCRGSTGPHQVNPESGKPYGIDFPVITIGDIVESQRWLIDHLEIPRLRAVVGGSLGGHQTLAWATRYPDRLAGAAVIASSARLTSQALAFDVIGRNAIMRDPHFHAGQYYDQAEGPSVGLALARMLGHITYLSQEAMTEKFEATRLKPREIRTQFETKFSVGSYLAHQGDSFVSRFDANSYLTLTMAMDLFDLGNTPENLVKTLHDTQCRWMLVSFTSDWLFPSFQSRELVDALISQDKPVSYCDIQSACGHDAFLLQDELELYGGMLEAFLANVTERDRIEVFTNGTADSESSNEAAEHRPTSIFHSQHRLDYQTLLELIPSGASVLDLGCGTGGLLARLRARGHDRLVGVEIDERALVTSVGRGLDVIHFDLNQGLPGFCDGQFDFVVLSRTLQTVMDVERLLDEMLRVGRQAIVSFPNLGFQKWRSQLADEGCAPKVDADHGLDWYNTPNVRFLTIADFEAFCSKKGFKILQRVSLDTEQELRVDDEPNRLADVAIVVLSR